MKIVKCTNGHYYDESINSSCPYCKSTGDIPETDRNLDYVIPDWDIPDWDIPDYNSPDDEGKTVGYNEYIDNEKTVAVNGLGTDADIQKSGGAFNPVVGWLVCLEGAEKGRDYRIVSGRNYVGRAVENNICIADDDNISRQRHFCIVYDPRSHRFFAVPGDSASIQVNGEVKFSKHLLQDGDIITCGGSKLCFIGFCKEGRDWT